MGRFLFGLAFIFGAALLATLPRGAFAQPNVSANNTDSIVIDQDGDVQADRGDTLQYDVTISNTGTAAALLVLFMTTIDSNSTFDPASLNISPLARDESYTTVGNTLLEVGIVPSGEVSVKVPSGQPNDSVLDNDQEFLGDTFTLIPIVDGTSANGGTVNLNSDGTFTYLPAAGFTGTDTFTYTIRDDGTDANAGNADDMTGTGIVSITVSNRVWYVNKSAPAGGTGRSNAPFNTLAVVTGASGPDVAGDIIFVYAGGAIYTGGMALLNTQILTGESVGLVVGGFNLVPAGATPTIVNGGGNAVTLAPGNTVQGFNLSSTGASGYSLAGTNFGTFTGSNLLINNSTGGGISLNTGTANLTLSGLTSSGSSEDAVSLTTVAGTLSLGGGVISGSVGSGYHDVGGSTAVVSYAGNFLKSTTGTLIDIQSRTGGAVTLSGNLSSTNSAGINVSSCSGGTFTFSGTTKILNMSGGGSAVTLTGNSGSQKTLFTNGGLDIDTTAGAGITADGSALTVDGPNNTIDCSTSGTCLLMSSTAAAGPGVTFAHCFANTGQVANINTSAGTHTLGQVSSSGSGASALFLGAAGVVNIGDPSVVSTLNTTFGEGIIIGATTLNITGAGLNVTTGIGGDGIVHQGGTVAITASHLAILTDAMVDGQGFVATGGGTVSLTGLATISSGSNTAINLAGMTIGASGLTFNSVTTGNAPNGILMSNVGQAAGSTGIDINGGSIANAVTRGVDLDAVSADVAIASAISTSLGGRSVEVTNCGSSAAGGNQLVFSGAITDPRFGINLDNNDVNNGATITFSGGLDLDTTTNAAFTAINGGTVVVTGTNTIDTTSGTALNVSNTTIGASGLTFQRVSSSGGSATGIILDNTGSSGGLTITGAGTPASGGTIASKTGSDGSTSTGIGIYLNSTSRISLTRMQLNDFGNFAIRGNNVNGFVFDNSVVSGISGSVVNAFDEAAIRFGGTSNSDGSVGLTGVASISNCNISGGFEYNIKILNNSGILNRLTMNSTTLGPNHDAPTGNGGDSFQIVTNNSATSNLSLTNCTFTSAGANTFNAGVASASNMDVVFRNNNVSNNHVNLAGAVSNVLVFSTSTGNVTYDVSNNTVLADTVSVIANTSNGIALAKGVPDTGSGGTMSGIANNNAIGQSGVAGSGSAFTGIFASSLGSGTHTTAITNNTIYRYNEEGIYLKANDPLTGGNSVLNAVLTGNRTLEPDSLAFAGIWVLAGSGSGSETHVINVTLGDVSAAAVAGSPTGSAQNDFTNGDPSNFSDVEIQEVGSASVLNLSKAGSGSATTSTVVADDNVGTPATDFFGTINLVTAQTVRVIAGPASAYEDGAVNIAYTFIRFGDTTSALTANFNVGGSAAFGTDYTQSGAPSFNTTSGTVTFGAGKSIATVTLDPTADASVEPNKTVSLTLTAGGYTVASPSAATTTILNDD